MRTHRWPYGPCCLSRRIIHIMMAQQDKICLSHLVKALSDKEENAENILLLRSMGKLGRIYGVTLYWIFLKMMLIYPSIHPSIYPSEWAAYEAAIHLRYSSASVRNLWGSRPAQMTLPRWWNLVNFCAFVIDEEKILSFSANYIKQCELFQMRLRLFFEDEKLISF